MLVFGQISSIFEFLTFAVMLGGFDAGPSLFRSGWFVESLATQTLVIFVIRTRRVPFVRSRPSRPLVLASFGVVAVGAFLPMSPLAGDLGFVALPAAFFAVLVAMIVVYLVLVDVAKRYFFAEMRRVDVGGEPVRRRRPREERRVARRAARWIHPGARTTRVGDDSSPRGGER
jgi:Mg2+-importing ATPase